jgi:Ca2+-transporting ATPase
MDNISAQSEDPSNYKKVDSEIKFVLDEAAYMSAEQVIAQLETNVSFGLSHKLAEKRLKHFGYNKLSKTKEPSALLTFIEQFRSPVILLLVVATVIAAIMQEFVQMIAIAVAILINAVIGFTMEFRANTSLRALEKLAAPLARVRRSGLEMEIPAADLVPGDLVILDAGSRVPADVKIVDAAGLSIDESMLTGESVPVHKSAIINDGNGAVTIGNQGTVVMAGRAKAVVVSTGDNTRLGQLGRQISEIDFSSTPLEKNLEELGHRLTWMVLFTCLILFLIGIICKHNIEMVLEISIALAIASIPEGLPIVATLALAVGTQRMVRENALIRYLGAIETLGCAQVICADKTGTLTLNQMSVTDIVVDKRHLQVSGSGYAPVGKISELGNVLNIDTEPILEKLLMAAALCNDARLESHAEDYRWHIHGDPTEGALITAVTKAGFDHQDLKSKYPRLREIPFDLTRKRMTTVHSLSEQSYTAFVKGSPESILAVSSRYLSNNGVKILDKETINWFNAQNHKLASEGKRTLAIAMRDMSANTDKQGDDIETNLILLGLVAMLDQIKPGVHEAIQSCKRAGIDVVMLTGDQAATAGAIAKELNIISNNNYHVVTGDHIEGMNSDLLRQTVQGANVLARIKPEMKLAIVSALQANGKVVAMTGDGVNDAAALRQADIGVCMGRMGTELAREASDMVITDDNFSTIVKAIEQGRTIYSNIARATAYLLTTSLATVLTIATTVVFSSNLFVTPLQILWLNLIMHIFPSLGIVLQKASPDVMTEPPRKSTDPFLGKYQTVQILLCSIAVAVVTIGVVSAYQQFSQETKLGTILITTLSMSLLFQAWSWLPSRRLGVQYSINWSMLVSSGLGLILLLLSLYLAPLRKILQMQQLSLVELTIILLLAAFSYCLSIALSKLLSKAAYFFRWAKNHPFG